MKDKQILFCELIVKKK